jgi:hypothetical protein
VRPEDVLVIPGPESDEGNVGYSCTDVAMHDEYFINIANCVADDGTPLLEGKRLGFEDSQLRALTLVQISR